MASCAIPAGPRRQGAPECRPHLPSLCPRIRSPAPALETLSLHWAHAAALGEGHQTPAHNSLALVLPTKAPLGLVPFLGQDKAQLLVGGEGGEGAVHTLAGLRRVPVVLPAQVDTVAAGRAFIVVPPCGALP